MSSLVKTGPRQWLAGGLILLFFIVISYGFIVVINNKTFTASIKSIRDISNELKLNHHFLNKNNIKSKTKIDNFFNKTIEKYKWINSINILYKEKDKLHAYTNNLDTKKLFLPDNSSYCDIHYNIKDFSFKLVLPLEVTANKSWYLFIDGNISYFFYLNYIIKVYVA